MSFVRSDNRICAVRLALAATGIISSGVILAGCQIALSRPVPKASMGNQGSASEVLFLTPEVLAMAEGVSVQEATRLDATLSPRADETAYDARPDLRSTRRVRVVDDSNTVVYFNPRIEHYRRNW
jgi:hypothetical protein